MSLKQFLIDRAIIAHNRLVVTLPLARLRASAARPVVPPTPHRFAIIPGDASNPSGSLGDMAMFSALMQSLRMRDPAAAFTIIGIHDHHIDVPGIGEVPVVAAWLGKAGSLAFDSLIRQHHALFVMGADILDGKYGTALVQRIADYCNHSVQLGIPATTLGFSFNQAPRYPAIDALARLNPLVTVNVRDQTSLDRFTHLVGIPARLCTDSAFLMPPASTGEPEDESWVARMRAAGRVPVGINLNAHALAPAIDRVGMGALIEHMASSLAATGARNKLAYLLIPHDLKPKSGDIRMLQLLDKRLRQHGFEAVRHSPISHPDRIKRIVGQLELVLTGRMHLAIASLGSGTPVLSIAYQDKFEGLYQHFHLSHEYILAPQECLTAELSKKLDQALHDRQMNRERIRQLLPAVKALALKNLELRQP